MQKCLHLTPVLKRAPVIAGDKNPGNVANPFEIPINVPLNLGDKSTNEQAKPQVKAQLKHPLIRRAARANVALQLTKHKIINIAAGPYPAVG